MKKLGTSIACALLPCAALLAPIANSHAQTAGAAQSYPSRPIRIIVQFGPGTSVDIMARVIAQKLGENWNQQVVVDNRPGAGGIIGTALGAKAPADGYTLTMVASGAFAVNPSLYSKLPYDAINDFAPITGLSLVPQTLVASPSAPFKSVKEFVAVAKQKPGQINYASLGSGTTSHLTMEMFRFVAGIELNHVSFKGSSDAHLQLMGGQVLAMFDPIPATRPQIQSGKLLGLGIASLRRSAFLPELPTIAEQGFPGFEALGWIGIAAPAQTPPAILDKLNAEIVKIVNQQEMKDRLAALAFTPVGDTREQFAAFIKAETIKWGKVVRDSGAKAD